MERAAPAAPTARADAMRGARYCEILIAERSGLRLAVDIYSSAGLNDCPDPQFRALDPGRLADQLGATRVIVKGPRYWAVDRIEGATEALEPARVVGGLEVRKIGRLEFSVLDAGDAQKPYRIHVVPGNGTFVFDAGHPVHELLGPDGAAYAMISFSVQKAPLTAPGLARLGERLKPADGWKFRSRVLAGALRVAPVAGEIRVVQDELDNSYVALPPAPPPG